MQFPLSHMPQCIGTVKTVPYRIPCLSYHYLLALIFRQAIHQPAVHIIKHFFAVGFVVQLMAGIVPDFAAQVLYTGIPSMAHTLRTPAP